MGLLLLAALLRALLNCGVNEVRDGAAAVSRYSSVYHAGVWLSAGVDAAFALCRRHRLLPAAAFWSSSAVCLAKVISPYSLGASQNVASSWRHFGARQ